MDLLYFVMTLQLRNYQAGSCWFSSTQRLREGRKESLREGFQVAANKGKHNGKLTMGLPLMNILLTKYFLEHQYDLFGPRPTAILPSNVKKHAPLPSRTAEIYHT